MEVWNLTKEQEHQLDVNSKSLAVLSMCLADLAGNAGAAQFGRDYELSFSRYDIKEARRQVWNLIENGMGDLKITMFLAAQKSFVTLEVPFAASLSDENNEIIKGWYDEFLTDINTLLVTQDDD